MAKSEKDLLNKLFIDNGLTIEDDIFTMERGGKTITLIKRTGIEKIKRKNNISVRYEFVSCERDFAAVKAIGTLKTETGIIIEETYGSASPKTVKSGMGYYLEMAEKRALSRVVLKLTKLYQEDGVMGEDEFNDEKKGNKIDELMNKKDK